MAIATMRRIFLLASVACMLVDIRSVTGYSIRVCQNKHCCKRSRADILQTMSNLIVVEEEGLPLIAVTSSGCLASCDIGPNVEVVLEGGISVVLHGMVDAQTCANLLGGVLDSQHRNDCREEARNDGDNRLPPPAKLLVAASKVMEQTQHKLADPIERIRYLTSVIDKLEGSSSNFCQSAANAHAHVLRAEQYFELQNFDAAISDAQTVVEGPLQKVATSNSLFLAYRTWADAERSVAESSSSRKRDYSRVVTVLQQWRKQQPKYQTKLQFEIQDLLASQKA